jgi:hypothetical protein
MIIQGEGKHFMHGHDAVSYLPKRHGRNGGQCRRVHVQWVWRVEGEVACIPMSMGRCWKPWSWSGGSQAGVEHEEHEKEERVV